jgi:alpha-D-ribose 1-methylphosphonate 5-triphosphate synthase subunit PhnH
LRLGTDEAPHLSATVVLDVREAAGGQGADGHWTGGHGTSDRGAGNHAAGLVHEANGHRDDGPTAFSARGPGIDGTATLAAPWASHGFGTAWRTNTELFPRGVDMLLVDVDAVTGLPRTTLLTEVEP